MGEQMAQTSGNDGDHLVPHLKLVFPKKYGDFMLKLRAQNIETLCWNIMLKVLRCIKDWVESLSTWILDYFAVV